MQHDVYIMQLMEHQEAQLLRCCLRSEWLHYVYIMFVLTKTRLSFALI